MGVDFHIFTFSITRNSTKENHFSSFNLFIPRIKIFSHIQSIERRFSNTFPAVCHASVRKIIENENSLNWFGESAKFSIFIQSLTMRFRPFWFWRWKIQKYYQLKMLTFHPFYFSSFFCGPWNILHTFLIHFMSIERFSFHGVFILFQTEFLVGIFEFICLILKWEQRMFHKS